ncbi:MAG: type IX secretion system membrane protein PorP/SprF [Bacteroidetes bacterium]|nr:type IX secretion system membrane protein PorP/SprF [Bacteroidota bacterium]
MKNIIQYCLLFLLPFSMEAQQLPQYTFFTYNYLNYNPAVTGNTPCLEAKVGYRMQWAEYEGAPRTGYVTVHNKFGVRRYNFHGIGAYVETDNAGQFGYTSLHANYAYHLKLTKGYSLSTGIGVGFMQYRFGYVGINMPQLVDDPAVQGSVGDIIFPVFNFGMWLYRKDKFFGISVRQLTSPKVDGFADTRLKRHYTFAYSRALQVGDDFSFKPAILVNYVGKSKPSLEGQALLEYKRKVAIGLAARSGHGVSGLVKLDVLPYLTVAYAYDITANRIRLASYNTHEITLGFRACGMKQKNHVPCAAYD